LIEEKPSLEESKEETLAEKIIQDIMTANNEPLDDSWEKLYDDCNTHLQIYM
jgi:hypothetical protein